MSSISRAYTVYAVGRGRRATGCCSKCCLRCIAIFIRSLKSTLSRYPFGWGGGVSQKRILVYAFDNVDSYGQSVTEEESSANDIYHGAWQLSGRIPGSQSSEPGFESCFATVSKIGHFRSLHWRPCWLSCINEYLAIDSGGHVSDLVVVRNCCMTRMRPEEAELVSEWTGLSGRVKSEKRFERSNGLDTALYKNYLLPFTGYTTVSVSKLI